MSPTPPKAAWAIVAKREIVAKLTDKTFLISTLVTTLILAAALGFNVFMSTRSTETKVAITAPPAEAIVQAAKAASPDDTWTTLKFERADEAIAAVDDGSADVFLEQGADGWTLHVKRVATTGSRGLPELEQAVASMTLAANAQAEGVSMADLTRGTQAKVVSIDGGSTEEQVFVFVAGIVFAMLFYMSSMLFGVQISQSVVQEKESRIVEILAAAIPVRQLLAGKVLGNSALALGQMVLYLGVGLIGLSFTDYASFLSQVGVGAAWFAAFFVTGFLALACLWAAAGSMATRTEEVSSTTTPLTILLVAAFLVALMSSGTTQTALSYVPVMSSILMPMRLLGGTAEWWEAAIALAANTAFMAVSIKVGEIIYRRGLLQVSGILRLSQAFKAAD